MDLDPRFGNKVFTIEMPEEYFGTMITLSTPMEALINLSHYDYAISPFDKNIGGKHVTDTCIYKGSQRKSKDREYARLTNLKI